MRRRNVLLLGEYDASELQSSELARPQRGWFLVARLFSRTRRRFSLFFLSLPSSRIPSSTRENVKVRRYNVAASVFSILSCCAHEYTRVYIYIYELDARIHIIVGICPLLRFVAALQKVGEGIISGFRGGRPAIRKLETRPGARYSVRGREGGELKQRDAGVRRRGREKEIRRERIGIPRVQGT